jgi:hypothetical protein
MKPSDNAVSEAISIDTDVSATLSRSRSLNSSSSRWEPAYAIPML